MSLARAYGIPHVIDYGAQRAGNGLVISLGAGMLMATMDEILHARWGVDIGPSRGNPAAAEWAEAVSYVVPWTVAHLWVSVSSPEWVRGLLQRFPANRLAVWSNLPLGVGYQAANTADLARWAARAEPAAAGRAQRGHVVVAGPQVKPGIERYSKE